MKDPICHGLKNRKGLSPQTVHLVLDVCSWSHLSLRSSLSIAPTQVTETLGDVLRGKVVRHLCKLFEEHLEGVRGVLGLFFLASHICFPLIVVYTSRRDRLMGLALKGKVWVDQVMPVIPRC